MKNLTLKQIAAKIAENAEAVHNGTVGWDEFKQRNEALWRQVDCGEVCVVGSAANRRCNLVNRYLGGDK